MKRGGIDNSRWDTSMGLASYKEEHADDEFDGRGDQGSQGPLQDREGDDDDDDDDDNYDEVDETRPMDEESKLHHMKRTTTNRE